ncbi:MAG: hypothetical protein DRJ68_03925 [Thermoprotei archaeon]|nr:MAG: hypothetical protein DRJ68_03925 [Thermoprotei archaeon]
MESGLLEQWVIGLSVFLACWGLIAVAYKLLNLHRYGFSLKPFLLVVRSKRIAERLEGFGKHLARPWRIFMSVGVALSAGLMVFAFYFLTSSLIARLSASTGGGVYVIIPGVTIGWHVVPYFVLAATITILIHEAFHAISFGSEGIPIKSFGVFLAAILPGGLVEADNEKFLSSKPLSKLRVYAAGSFSNFLVFLLALGLMSATISPTPNGVLVFNTLEGYPAHGVIMSWDVIVAINGERVYSLADLDRILGSIPPGTTINVTVLRGDNLLVVTLTTAPSPKNSSRSFMGVDIGNYFPPTVPWLSGEVYWHWFSSLYWLRLISFSVAMFNMLPIPLLDGSGFVRSIVEGLLKDNKKASNLIINLIGSISLFLLLVNILIPALRP